MDLGQYLTTCSLNGLDGLGEVTEGWNSKFEKYWGTFTKDNFAEKKLVFDMFARDVTKFCIKLLNV